MSGWNFSLGCHLKSNLVPNNKWPQISLTPKNRELCHVMQAAKFTDGLEAFTQKAGKKEFPHMHAPTDRHTSEHVHTYRQTYKWTCTHLQTDIWVSMQVNTCMHANTRRNEQMHTQGFVHQNECTWVNIYTCGHTCAFAWTHLHTQAHCWHPTGVNNTQTGGLDTPSLATTSPF